MRELLREVIGAAINLGVGVLVGAALVVGVWGVQVATKLVVYGRRPPRVAGEAGLAAGLEVVPEALSILMSPLVMLAAVAIEEYVFRALLLRWLWKSMGLTVALFLSAALFGGVHALNERPPRFSWAVVGAVAAGLALGGAYAASGSLAQAIGLHFGWNYVQWSVLGYPLYGFGVEGLIVTRPVAGKPDWLTGGRMGAEESALAVAAMLLAAAAYAFWLMWHD